MAKKNEMKKINKDHTQNGYGTGQESAEDIVFNEKLSEVLDSDYQDQSMASIGSILDNMEFKKESLPLWEYVIIITAVLSLLGIGLIINSI